MLRGRTRRGEGWIGRITLILIATLSLSLCVASTSRASLTPPALRSVHAARDATWHWQRAAGRCCRPYHWLADRHTTSKARRWRIAASWWGYASQAHTRYVDEASQTCLGAIHAYFPSYAWSAAVSIASRESGLDAYAKNPGSSASGCFQLMSFWWDGSNAYGWVFNPFDARANVQHAYLMWQRDGGFCPGQWCL